MQLTIVPLLLIARTSLADPINCEASTATTVAGLVCSDTNLRERDRDLEGWYYESTNSLRAAIQTATRREVPLFEETLSEYLAFYKKWVAERNECTTNKCLSKSYDKLDKFLNKMEAG